MEIYFIVSLISNKLMLTITPQIQIECECESIFKNIIRTAPHLSCVLIYALVVSQQQQQQQIEKEEEKKNNVGIYLVEIFIKMKTNSN